jgi:uncharacterized protein (UPF0262 family)
VSALVVFLTLVLIFFILITKRLKKIRAEQLPYQINAIEMANRGTTTTRGSTIHNTFSTTSTQTQRYNFFIQTSKTNLYFF